MLAGLMQHVPITLNLVRERVATLLSNKVVTTRYPSQMTAATYGEVLQRAARPASFLRTRGVGRGSRLASLAWNSQRHLELYLGVPCMGAVSHAINARISAQGIANLLAHANDEILFIDQSIWRTVAWDLQLPSCIRHVVDGGRRRSGAGDAVRCYVWSLRRSLAASVP